jgi:hypothetical protein
VPSVRNSGRETRLSLQIFKDTGRRQTSAFHFGTNSKSQIMALTKLAETLVNVEAEQELAP